MATRKPEHRANDAEAQEGQREGIGSHEGAELGRQRPPGDQAHTFISQQKPKRMMMENANSVSFSCNQSMIGGDIWGQASLSPEIQGGLLQFLVSFRANSNYNFQLISCIHGAQSSEEQIVPKSLLAVRLSHGEFNLKESCLGCLAGSVTRVCKS